MTASISAAITAVAVGSKAPGGIPWFVFIDSDGRAIVTSDDPVNGNVGFPAQDSEIAYFKKMLQKVAKGITAEEIETLGKSLVAFRDVTLPR